MAGFLAGLDAEVVAVLFLIAMLGAAIVLRGLTSSAAHGVPVVGAQLGQAVDQFWVRLFVALTPAANGALGVFTSSLDWITAQWSGLASTVVGLAQLTYAAAHKIAYEAIPHATGLVLVQAGALASAALAQALLQVHRAETVAAAGFAAAEARALALYSQGLAVSLGLFRTAERDAAFAVAVAERDALALAAAERAFAVAGIATAEAYAGTLLGQALAQMHAIEAGLLGQLGGVSQADERAIQDTLAKLRTEIADASKAVSAAATGSIAAVALDVALIKAMKCIKFCDQLGAMGEFASLLDMGLILALVEAAQANPKGLQDFIAGTVAPLIRAEWPTQ